MEGCGCLSAALGFTDIPAAWLTPGFPPCVSQDVGPVSWRHQPVALKGCQVLGSDGAVALRPFQKMWVNPPSRATVLGKVGNPHLLPFSR